MEEEIRNQIYEQLKRLGKLTEKVMGFERISIDGLSKVKEISEEMVTLAYFLIEKRG